VRSYTYPTFATWPWHAKRRSSRHVELYETVACYNTSCYIQLASLYGKKRDLLDWIYVSKHLPSRKLTSSNSQCNQCGLTTAGHGHASLNSGQNSVLNLGQNSIQKSIQSSEPITQLKTVLSSGQFIHVIRVSTATSAGVNLTSGALYAASTGSRIGF
jgi:hypothetical protein